MSEYQLRSAINAFTELVLNLTDDQLERDWTWGSYDSEGVRFAFFRLYEELRDLGALIHQKRNSTGAPLTGAQNYLSRYHAAYLDLQALLLGISPEKAEQAPSEDEWSLRRTVAHIIGADLGFYVTIKFALDRHRQGFDPLVEIADETWLDIAGMNEKRLDSIMDGPLDGLQSYHRHLHAQILADFVSINPDELQMPSKYWEKEALSLSFRLGRFDSHLRQHTVQIEKTMASMGIQPNEAKRLLRLIYTALAEVEGALLGAPEINRSEVGLLVEKIATLTEEIRPILS
jgi:hypothetical protein